MPAWGIRTIGPMISVLGGVSGAVPEPGQLVLVRNRQGVVADVDRSGRALAVLARPEEAVQNLAARKMTGATTLPGFYTGRFDLPDQLDASLTGCE